MKPYEKKEIVRSSVIRLKGLSLILEGILEGELPVSDLIIQEVRVALSEVTDKLLPLTTVK